MENHKDALHRLKTKLNAIENRQNLFSQEILELKLELNQLKTPETLENISTETPTIELSKTEILEEKTAPLIIEPQPKNQIKKKRPSTSPLLKKGINLEKFIGENLISKIGILIIIIGVTIGAKYSIEHNLISPLTRIVLGYLVGFGLLGVGIKLKTNYKNYSAVLVSGAIAIHYFITYTAYDFYGLFPQELAFVLMLVFTVFTVITALHYNKQIIAHIGLVGAYAVPFLLSSNSGKDWILLTYVTIINVGILIISFKKYWRPLFINSFVMSWLIYIVWSISGYSQRHDFYLALGFLLVFYIIFYATFLVFKLRNLQKLKIADIILPLINSFIFYAIGYVLISDHRHGDEFLGMFTFFNAIIHFGVGMYIYKQKLADKSLFYLISIFTLTFITITVPVQLDGNWVTLLWISEATLLFWIGRTKKIAIYETVSYPLMVLALISLYIDWNVYSHLDTNMLPLFNIGFLTSILFAVSFGYLHKTNIKFTSTLNKEKSILKIISFAFPALFVGILYMAFQLEIVNYFDQLYDASMLIIDENKYYNYDLPDFKTIWMLLYTMFFLTVMSFVNIKKLKNPLLANYNLILNFLSLILFLVIGLYAISDLRSSYIYNSMENVSYYNINAFHIGIRYLSYVFVVALLLCNYQYLKQSLVSYKQHKALGILQYVIILWLASSELIHLLDLSGFSETYKLGLSILWGVYALLLISLGIWKNKKHLRIGAIALFAVTLAKLFLYDISHLNTISKTIVFLSLGALLLIISFLYNKFKHLISDEN